MEGLEGFACSKDLNTNKIVFNNMKKRIIHSIYFYTFNFCSKSVSHFGTSYK